MSNEADIFDEYYPELTEQESIQAGQDGRIIQSFNAHPISNADGTILALAIKLKLTNGATETVLIGHYAALIIRMMISDLEASHWTGLVTLEKMRAQPTNAAAMDLGTNILKFRHDTAAASRCDTSAALDLVSEVASVITGISNRAADSEARAKALAKSALERLQLAEARIYSAEAARDLAEETLSELSAKLEEPAPQAALRPATAVRPLVGHNDRRPSPPSEQRKCRPGHGSWPSSLVAVDAMSCQSRGT